MISLQYAIYYYYKGNLRRKRNINSKCSEDKDNAVARHKVRVKLTPRKKPSVEDNLEEPLAAAVSRPVENATYIEQQEDDLDDPVAAAALLSRPIENAKYLEGQAYNTEEIKLVDSSRVQSKLGKKAQKADLRGLAETDSKSNSSTHESVTEPLSDPPSSNEADSSRSHDTFLVAASQDYDGPIEIVKDDVAPAEEEIVASEVRPVAAEPVVTDEAPSVATEPVITDEAPPFATEPVIQQEVEATVAVPLLSADGRSNTREDNSTSFLQILLMFLILGLVLWAFTLLQSCFISSISSTTTCKQSCYPLSRTTTEAILDGIQVPALYRRKLNLPLERDPSMTDSKNIDILCTCC